MQKDGRPSPLTPRQRAVLTPASASLVSISARRAHAEVAEDCGRSRKAASDCSAGRVAHDGHARVRAVDGVLLVGEVSAIENKTKSRLCTSRPSAPETALSSLWFSNKPHS